MVSVESLVNAQSIARGLAEEMGLTVEELTDDELTLLARSFERQLILNYPEREIVDIFVRNQPEIVLGAMIARAQFKIQFGGESPAAGRYGMVITRASFLGIADDWENIPVFTTGSPQNWIHSGTTLLAGTVGNPIRIGENAVHVILAIGSLHPSPKIESVKFVIDGKEKPILLTGFQLKRSGLAIKELDDIFIWNRGKTILGQVYISGAYGATAEDYPYLLGVSFIPEAQLRVHNPANVIIPENRIVFTT